MSRVLIGACLKLVDRRPEIDPLTGAVHDDARFAGPSDADLAALEWALRCADAWGGEVLAVSAGPIEAEEVLRAAVAVGAARAVRVDVPARASSELVAAALAPLLEACRVVWCGDHSLDRGSGAVPAYVAARLHAEQALGLIGVELGDDPGSLLVTRRLDGGRRERLRLAPPAVASVEGSTARLRRATMAGTLSARDVTIGVVPGPAGSGHMARTRAPYRPRARALPGPTGASALARIVELTGAHAAGSASAVVELAPDAAADRILTALAEWGYLDAPEG